MRLLPVVVCLLREGCLFLYPGRTMERQDGLHSLRIFFKVQTVVKGPLTIEVHGEKLVLVYDRFHKGYYEMYVNMVS